MFVGAWYCSFLVKKGDVDYMTLIFTCNAFAFEPGTLPLSSGDTLRSSLGFHTHYVFVDNAHCAAVKCDRRLCSMKTANHTG